MALKCCLSSLIVMICTRNWITGHVWTNKASRQHWLKNTNWQPDKNLQCSVATLWMKTSSTRCISTRRLCIIVSLRRQLSGGGADQVVELVVRVRHRHEESVWDSTINILLQETADCCFYNLKNADTYLFIQFHVTRQQVNGSWCFFCLLKLYLLMIICIDMIDIAL